MSGNEWEWTPCSEAVMARGDGGGDDGGDDGGDGGGGGGGDGGEEKCREHRSRVGVLTAQAEQREGQQRPAARLSLQQPASAMRAAGTQKCESWVRIAECACFLRACLFSSKQRHVNILSVRGKLRVRVRWTDRR